MLKKNIFLESDFRFKKNKKIVTCIWWDGENTFRHEKPRMLSLLVLTLRSLVGTSVFPISLVVFSFSTLPCHPWWYATAMPSITLDGCGERKKIEKQKVSLKFRKNFSYHLPLHSRGVIKLQSFGNDREAGASRGKIDLRVLFFVLFVAFRWLCGSPWWSLRRPNKNATGTYGFASCCQVSGAAERSRGIRTKNMCVTVSIAFGKGFWSTEGS